MSSRVASAIATEVASRARGLDLFLRRIERLHAERRLPAQDVERAYAGALLEFHAYTERAVERLFVGLLRGRLKSAKPSVRPLVTVQSDATAYAIVSGDRSYVDWLPYRRFTTRRAEAFFASGRPFTDLDKSDVAVLEESAVVRNAIAHQSSSALRQFREKLVQGKALPPNQQRPAGYLRGTHTIGQTRMNHLLSRVVQVMSKLSA